MEAHTNADDATRYRDDAEVAAWREHDPIALLERELRTRGLLDDDGVGPRADGGRGDGRRPARADERRTRCCDPMDLFAHVYAEQTTQLREQARAAARPSWTPRPTARRGRAG